MSGKRTKALRREFKAGFGRAPETNLIWVDPKGNPAGKAGLAKNQVMLAGNEFRTFKHRRQACVFPK